MTEINNKQVTGIIFSKDRPLQLHATLSSFLDKCQDSTLAELFVIYKADSARFHDQYQQLIAEFPTITFIQQRNFQTDLFLILGIQNNKISQFFSSLIKKKNYQNPFAFFLVDDNIFFQKFSLLSTIEALSSQQNALGFALQLGVNINYCYPLDIPVKITNYEEISNNVIKYNWSTAGSGLDYPLEVSSSIYRSDLLTRLLSELQFNNPNNLESEMANRAYHYSDSLPYLLCFKESVTFCNPINKVQSIYKNRAGLDHKNNITTLAEKFNEGYRVDINQFNGFISNACHQEVELPLIKTPQKKRSYLLKSK